MNFFRNFIFLFVVQILFQTHVYADGITKYKLRKVVIDAGHGGKDPGAPGKHTAEKNIALAIALKLGNFIENNLKDVEVIYTRKTDVFVELDRRAAIANESKADLFISIHCNANESPSFYGSCTYVMGLNKANENLELAKQENSVILIEDNFRTRYEGFDPNSPESIILFSLVSNTFLEQSMVFGSKIQNQLKERAGRQDNGVKQAGLVVLWKTTMPAVLIETGYISNPSEEKFIYSAKGQTLIASGIYKAFCDYKNWIESRSDVTVSNDKVRKEPKVISENKSIKTEPLESLSTSKQKQKHNQNKTNQNSQKTKIPIQASTAEVNNNANKENNQLTDNEIRFKVQLLSSKDKVELSSKKFKGIENIEELTVDGIFKYVVGNERKVKEILLLQVEIRKKFPDAFVVAYKNGQKIPFDQAVREQKQNK